MVGNSSFSNTETPEDLKNNEIEVKVENMLHKSTDEPENLSKSARKRLEKKKIWEKNKLERRAKEREKRKKRKLENPAPSTAPSRKKLKETTMAKSSCKTGVVIDLSFDHLMDEKNLAKCIKQVSRCYSVNRRAENPVQFHVCSLEGQSLVEITKHQGYINWDVNFHEKDFTEVFAKENIVYLTAESDNVIEKVEDDKVYIIGGLVDHNSQKGLCHRLAIEKGFHHARLPISENIDLKTRRVLTIDHVFNIMVNICNGQSWKEALLNVLPARKGAKEKSADEDSE
nr:EOG090X0D3U [Eurycercus lamellatus]